MPQLPANHHPGSTSGTEHTGTLSAAVGFARLEGPSRAGTRSDENTSPRPCGVTGLMQALVDDPLAAVSRNVASMPSKEERWDESIASHAEVALKKPVDAVGSWMSYTGSDGQNACGEQNGGCL